MQVVKSFWRVMALVVVLAGFGATAFAGPASAADDSVWLCKPGQVDNPCLGAMDGQNLLKGGGSSPLGYTTNTNTPVDCFYVYPTQSEQPTANANFDADQELKDVAVNQARQFSRVCDVYAPIYRQYTFKQPVTDEVRDIAYGDVVKAWNNYLENYNNGRGVIIIGHSQGSSHLARLINEHIDNNPAVRDRVISSIIPGANVYVKKGQKVGGQFQNIPACETGSQLNCVIAYSAYLNEPEPSSAYGRVSSGYWINPNPRPSSAEYEVLCVNPAQLNGSDILKPLANLDVFLGNPEGAAPWLGEPDYYNAECRTAGTGDGLVNWLNVAKIDPSDSRPDLAGLVANSSGNLHLGDINLALDSLVNVAQSETDAYIAREADRSNAADRRPGVAKKLAKAKASLKKSKATVRKSGKAMKKAAKKCRKAASRKAAPCKAKKRLARKKAKAAKQTRSLNRQVSSLTTELKQLDAIINHL